MKQSLSILLLILVILSRADAQPILTSERSVEMALGNQQYLRSAQLNLTQQQQLLGGVKQLNNPVVSVEVSPYDGPLAALEQNFNLPALARSRKALQNERIHLAELQLLGNQYELKREVRLQYLNLQYFYGIITLLRSQDSLFQSIKEAAKRFFEAGQINKLEELTATIQADKVRNELNKNLYAFKAEMELMNFYLGVTDNYTVETLMVYPRPLVSDTTSVIIKQLLQQRVNISKQELQTEKAELLPTFSGGLLLPLSGNYQRFVGIRAGVAVPIFRKQNRSRIEAAKTGVSIAESVQALEGQRYTARFRKAIAKLTGDSAILMYYTLTALPQSRSIIETSQRLFQGGELNYIESLRNLNMAFTIQADYLAALKSYNESIIELNYLNATL